MSLDLSSDVVALTEALVDIESVSLGEQAISDAVEAALRGVEHLEVTRIGHSLVARTDLGRDERVVIAGHLDTVPLNDNLPVRNDGTSRRSPGLTHSSARPSDLRGRMPDVRWNVIVLPSAATSAPEASAVPP